MVWKNLFAGSNAETAKENRLMDTGGGGEKVLTFSHLYGESDMETYITICKIDSQWEFAVYSENTNSSSVST